MIWHRRIRLTILGLFLLSLIVGLAQLRRVDRIADPTNSVITAEAVATATVTTATATAIEAMAVFNKTESFSTVPKTEAGVPKLLHLIYKSEKVLEAYRPVLESCIKLNNDWTIVLWTDRDIQYFIKTKFPKLAHVFNSFKHKIQRTDAIRYLILFMFGGVYMDMDMVCQRPLSSSLSNMECFLDKEREHQTRFLHGRPYSAMNSAMGCTPEHPFMKKVIDFVFHSDRLKGGFRFPQTIFDTTGPAMLTKQYQQWTAGKPVRTVVLLNETYFSPKVNPRSGVYGNCRKRIAQIRKNPKRSLSDSACLEMSSLGYEKSDKLFETDRTVAIHQFTHLGYYEQKSKAFHAFDTFVQLHNASVMIDRAMSGGGGGGGGGGSRL